MLSLLLAAALAADPKPVAESITVTVVGTLKTGIVAIGAETTGATITANGITWEVDTGDSEELRQAAAKLSDKQVRLSGTLERRKGVEVKERWIVHVKSLQAVEAFKKGAAAPQAIPQPGFEVTPDKKDSRLGFMGDDRELIIDVASDSGIGGAKIKRLADKWPADVHVRLHLKGLEQFDAGNNDVKFKWGVSNSDGVSRMSLWKGTDESPVKADAREHTLVTHVRGNPNDSDDKGYFDVPLPAVLFAENPPEIRLGWIDFFR